MEIDLRNSQVVDYVAMSADEAHAAHIFDDAVAVMKDRINEFADRGDLQLVVAIVRPKAAVAASAPPVRPVLKTSAATPST
jgi:hypothetical protein